MSNGGSGISASVFTAGALLCLTAGFLYFAKLDVEYVSDEDEARVLLTAAEMNRRGSWSIPSTEGGGRLEQTPLYVWAVKLASGLRRDPSLGPGENVTPLAGRLPAAVSVFLMVLLGAWWAHQHLTRYPRADSLDLRPENFALLTGLLLATCPPVFLLARRGVPDSMFAFFCLASLYCLGESIEARRSFFAARPWRQWILSGYLMLGLAVMTRGPAAFLYVLPAYALTCWLYRMRVPDWIHLPGLALAALFGGWWYALAVASDPAAAGVFMREFVGNRFGSGAVDDEPFYYYFEHFYWFFPWIFLAAALAWRNLRRIERTPTQSLWSCALVCGIVWLSCVGAKSKEIFLPVAPFILLLAGDALARWDFGSRAGTFTRRGIRIFRWIALLAGIPMSLWIASDFGLVLSLALLVFTALFAFHRQRSSYVYALWERTVHWAALLVIVFLGAEAVYVLDYLPRHNLIDRNRGFIAQVVDHMPEGADLSLIGRQKNALFSYHLGRLLPILESTDELDELAGRAGARTYVLSDESVPSLMEDPRLAAVVTKIGGSRMRTRAALFKVIPGVAPEVGPSRDRYRAVGPLRLALIGDVARGGYGDVERMADAVFGHYRDQPLHEIILMGRTLAGTSRIDRIDFLQSFEAPWEDLLARGVPFHGVLSEDEESWVNWRLSEYEPFQMAGRRYYARDFRGGLVRLYALDSRGLIEEGGPEEDGAEQWRWLIEDLEAVSGRIYSWLVVAIDRPLASLAVNDENDEDLARQLLPLFDRYGVELVVWGREAWYQRVRVPGRAPTYLGAGWSGRVSAGEDPFTDDRRPIASANTKPGLLLMDFLPDLARIRAVEIDGALADVVYLDSETGPLDPEIGEARWAEAENR